jgi:hypothetical protein
MMPWLSRHSPGFSTVNLRPDRPVVIPLSKLDIDREIEGKPLCERRAARSMRKASLGTQSAFTTKLNFREASARLSKYRHLITRHHFPEKA